MTCDQGAVLTHGNLIANVAGTSIGVKFYPSDVLVLVLLPHHLSERTYFKIIF